MKGKILAHIPTRQYEFISVEYEFDGLEEENKALAKLEDLCKAYNGYFEKKPEVWVRIWNKDLKSVMEFNEKTGQWREVNAEST